MISTGKMRIVKKTQEFDIQKEINALKKEKAILLFKDSKTDFDILIDESFSSELLCDIEFLKNTLNKICGEEIFFYHNKKENKHSFIFRIDECNKNIKDDGYSIKTENENIIISALCENGISNGIYRFCEDYLKCMFVRSDYDYIPKTDTIYLDNIDITSNPDFFWRRIYQYEVTDTNWYKKIQSNGTADKSWGNVCHTVFSYVDPDIYFDEHPEYFSLVDGKRTKDQLCLSNPDIYPIISESADRMIKNKPDALYWDFSINDNMHKCECENCRKMEEEYGGFAPTLFILNKLAKEHPDKIFSTLAYFFSEDPPRNVAAQKNINVKLAPISSGQKFAFEFEGNEKAKKTKKLIADWSNLISDLYLWDYIVNFKHSLLPYPNFDVQRDNLKFYKAHNVTHVFHQGCRDKCAELSCLRSYIMGRQLWDIDVDTDSLIAKYLVVTYKKAAPFIAQYLETMHDLLRNKANDLDLYENPRDHKDDYLSTSAIKKYRYLLDCALESEKDDEEITFRLEEILINVLYAQINDVNANKDEIENYISQFKYLTEKHGIDRYNEWNKPTLDDLYAQNEEALNFRDTDL